MSSKTDFLNSLTKDLQPVKPLAKPEIRLVVWLIFSAVSVTGLMVYVQSFRPEFTHQLGANRFTFEIIFGLAPFFLAGWMSMRDSVPGLQVQRHWLWISVLFYIGFYGLLLFSQHVEPSLPASMAGKRETCYYEVLTLSWLPLAWLAFQIRKGYPQKILTLSLLTGIAASCLPMTLMHMACMYIPEHIITHHIYPSFIVVGLFAVFGHWIYKPKY